MTFTSLGNLFRFPLQTLDRFARITVQAALTLNIVTQLRNPCLQGFDRRHRPRFLIVQRVTLYLQPLQNRRRDRLFLSQRRHSILTSLPLLYRLPRRRLCLRRRRGPRAQFIRRCGQGLIGLAPASIQQHTFCPTQRLANLAITGRLPGLTRQLA